MFDVILKSTWQEKTPTSIANPESLVIFLALFPLLIKTNQTYSVFVCPFLYIANDVRNFYFSGFILFFK